MIRYRRDPADLLAKSAKEVRIVLIPNESTQSALQRTGQ